MRKASRIYKRKSRSNLETLIILIGAIIILGVAFYLAREKSYIPPENQVTQITEQEVVKVTETSMEENITEISTEKESAEAAEAIVQEKKIVPEPVVVKEEVPLEKPVEASPEKTSPSIAVISDTEKTNNAKNYTIQVGAFSSEKNALKLATEIEKSGFETFVVKGTNLYKVQVEEFVSYSDAEKIVPKLKALGCPTFITTK